MGGCTVLAVPRIGVVDLGTNSTRLLVADVDDGAVTEVERRTVVTRFGEGVDATGRLAGVERIVRDEVPSEVREATKHGIAVAGTATTLAAIDQELDPYDRDKVHGYLLGLTACERMLAMLAALQLVERREVTGLHPDRAPSIVAGAGILVESIRAFGLEAVEISESDILHGAALAAADGWG